jgi:pyruvate kinase
VESVRSTKIVCTLGPATSSAEMIGRLLDAGMDVVRLNFSHGTQDEKGRLVKHVRELAESRGRWVPIIADLQGPKIRTGPLPQGQPVELRDDSTVEIVPGEGFSSASRITIDYPRLAEEIRPGERILLADGAIELQVIGVGGGVLRCRVVNGGLLGERKGVNVPGAALSVPAITEKDKADLRFALERDVDFIALSFVRDPRDLLQARALVETVGAGTPLIAKLEKPQALDRLDEILAVADAVMVARGDLGVELSPAQVPVEQKRIIARAAELRKPVITATQMLESMISSPRPTRAEASDVANAVFDGSDALMLSGETAVGRYPVETVRMMAQIIERAEASGAACPPPPARRAGGAAPAEVSDAVAETAVWLSSKIGVKVLTVYTESGYTARLVSKHRSGCPVVGLSRHPEVCRQMGLLWGVRPCRIGHITDVDAVALQAEALLLSEQMVESGDRICLVAGTPFAVRGKTDLIKVHRIGDSGP